MYSNEVTTKVSDLVNKMLKAEMQIKSGKLAPKWVRSCQSDIREYNRQIEALVSPRPVTIKAQEVKPAAQTPAAPCDWRNDPATPAQYNLLRQLGVDVKGTKLTKGRASMAIDMIKSGNGVGSVGLFFTDGSN